MNETIFDSVSLQKMWRIQAMAHKRHKNNNGADEIAQAIHHLVDAMQPIPSQPRVMIPLPPTPRVTTMEDFMRHKPTKFNDKATFDGADA